jgi:hypothetical protein
VRKVLGMYRLEGTPWNWRALPPLVTSFRGRHFAAEHAYHSGLWLNEDSFHG